MSLANMHEYGVRAVQATCEDSSSGHSGSVNVDDLPDPVPVPDVALRLRWSLRSRTARAYFLNTALYLLIARH
jgi:hypothetical protein